MANKYTSPVGGKRGCLGKNGKYHVDNCKGELRQQGIGKTTGGTISNVTNN